MLPVPLKKPTTTASDVELGPPLFRLVERTVGESEAFRHTDDFSALDSLRAAAVRAEAFSEAGVAAAANYAAALMAAERRLPDAQEDVAVPFGWHDAFKPASSAAVAALGYERAAVVFNCGALYSLGACTCDRSDGEGLKVACRRFQLAAGAFEDLRAHSASGLEGRATLDLSGDVLAALVQLMLAQAQACFYEKASQASAKLKPSLIAKVALQANVYYAAAHAALSASPVKEHIQKSWPAFAAFQAAAFEAAAEFCMSQHHKAEAAATGKGYGAEVARLARAEALLSAALPTARKSKLAALSAPALASAEGLLAAVARRRADALHDNNTIYLEVVPQGSALPPIGTASMVKPLPPPAAATASGLFATLLPRAARAAVDELKATTRAAAESLAAAAAAAADDARAILAAGGLPGALSAHQSGAGLPAATWAAAARAQTGGGMHRLRASQHEVASASAGVADLVAAIERSLSEESLVAAQAHRSSAASPEEVRGAHASAAQLQGDVAHYRALWEQAAASDAGIGRTLDDPKVASALALCERPRHELDALVPPRAPPRDNDFDTATLLALLQELAALIDGRDRAVERVRASQRAQDARLTKAVAAVSLGGGFGDAAADPSAPVPDALAKVLEADAASDAAARAAVDAADARQPALLVEIAEENDRFAAAAATDPASLERQRLLQAIENGVLQFESLGSQLAHGLSFYTDLLARLRQLKQTCADHAYTQSVIRNQRAEGLGRSAQEAEDAKLAARLSAELNVLQPPPSASAAPPPYMPPTGYAPPAAYAPGAAAGPPPPPPAYGAPPSAFFGTPPSAPAPPPSYDAPPFPEVRGGAAGGPPPPPYGY